MDWVPPHLWQQPSSSLPYNVSALRVLPLCCVLLSTLPGVPNTNEKSAFNTTCIFFSCDNGKFSPIKAQFPQICILKSFLFHLSEMCFIHQPTSIMTPSRGPVPKTQNITLKSSPHPRLLPGIPLSLTSQPTQGSQRGTHT